ncbi:MAG TPA: SusC/RagA family TonB-linked outer membrane protein [Flavisolibacter sp.]|nr:SusC/RagA family TonB-linked outer membrane protein [Flavisolibacter sp.]
MRKIVSLLSMLMLFCALALAQTRTVTGTVRDAQGNPVPFASVIVRGTNVGASADQNGNFSIQAAPGAVLEISAAGFQATTATVAAQGPVNVSITAATNLSEVVVTAMGIRREKKALGYAVSTIDKKDLEQRPESDVVRLLNGKAPGVDILNSSGMSGSGTNIIIRGVSTITGGSTPLFVVDGVPFDASTRPQASFVYGNTTSSRFLDLDPNQIESINVLKGLSATTLYGEQGRNGVILITTKNGAQRRSPKGTEITVNQSLFVNRVANLPEYQQSYGGGFDQSLGLAFFSNWGAKFTDPPALVPHPYDRAALRAAFPQFVGAMYEYKPYNSVERFFRTGTINTSSINIAGGGQNTNFNANFGHTDDQGFTPGNSLRKNNFGLGGNATLANNFVVSGTFNYATTNFKSPPTSTSFGSNPSTSSVFGNLIYTPIAVDLIGLPWENPVDRSSVYYRGGNDIQHPIWTVNNSFTGQTVNRIFGNMQLSYKILRNLNLSYRIGYDNYSDYNFLSQNKGGTVGGNQYQLGIHRTVDGVNTIWNHTVIANFNQRLNDDLDVTIDAGFDSYDRIYEQRGLKSTQQLVFGLFDHDNFINHETVSEDGSPIDFKTQSLSLGAFAQGAVGFRDFLYLNVGGRNSWNSHFESNNRSIFYPSVSVSFVPTSAIAGLRDVAWMNYAKFRAGYSTSANFGTPYGTRPTLSINTNTFQDRAGTVINVNAIGNRLANPNLKPELLREIEVGFESRLFNNRANIDLSLYRRVAEDQILERELDPATGFTVSRINAGSVRNKGIELQLGVTPVRTRDFNWNITNNFTLNRSLVFDLPSDVKQIVIDGFTNEGLFAINGQPLGVIQSTFAVKDPVSGQRLVDNNGNYVPSPGIGIIGNPTPDFKLSTINTLGYKGFSFRMQWDYTQGGDMLAYTPGTLIGRGLTKDTDFDRTLQLILPGVKASDPKVPNDVQISVSEAYFSNLSGFFGYKDLITYDATVFRLREASLSYSLPTSLIEKTPFGGIQLNISGQNLWYNAPNFPKYTRFDPETSSLGVSNVRGLEYLSGPTSKRLGASLRVSF